MREPKKNRTLKEARSLVREWDEEIADDLTRECVRDLMLARETMGYASSPEFTASTVAAAGLLQWLEARRQR